jgi:hypothetical protein
MCYTGRKYTLMQSCLARKKPYSCVLEPGRTKKFFNAGLEAISFCVDTAEEMQIK